MQEWIKSVTLVMHNYGIDGFQADELYIETYSHAKTIFDEKGNVLEEINFTKDGDAESRYVHRYDGQGRVLETLYYSSDELTDRRTYERMADGTVVRELKHYLDGSFDAISYYYDDHGQLTEKVTSDEEGYVESKTVFEYLESRRLSEKEMDGEGAVISEKKYTYDDKGNLTEFEEWNSDNDSRLRTVEEYDDQGLHVLTSRYINGKLRERIGYTPDEQGRVAQMTEENERGASTYWFEYDQAGNVLVQEETDLQGEVISRMERTFDEGGKLLENKVFIDGRGRRMSQHYRIEYVYEWEGDALA
ncbi:MAG: hypothetical protein PHD25_02300 [Bacteroidales bacterium]|nr:hypothetical protein [Bacteroidales bacterium]